MGLVKLVIGVGVLFLVVAIGSLVSGRTRSKQSWDWIYREEQPGMFWSAVGSYALAGVMFLVVAWVKRNG